MKITPEHYQAILTACATIKEKNPQATPEAYEKMGRSAERFRWDLFHAAGSVKGRPSSRALYSYLNDSNVDTGLKKIISTLYPTKAYAAALDADTEAWIQEGYANSPQHTN